jgi:hypothetical protein
MRLLQQYLPPADSEQQNNQEGLPNNRFKKTISFFNNPLSPSRFRSWRISSWAQDGETPSPGT